LQVTFAQLTTLFGGGVASARRGVKQVTHAVGGGPGSGVAGRATVGAAAPWGRL